MKLIEHRKDLVVPKCPNWPKCGWWSVKGFNKDGRVRNIGFAIGIGPPLEILTMEMRKPTDYLGNYGE